MAPRIILQAFGRVCVLSESAHLSWYGTLRIVSLGELALFIS